MNQLTKAPTANVSNRLPVTITGNEIKTSSGGLVAALEGLPHERYQLLWLGWPGSEIPEPERQRDLRQRASRMMRCIPPTNRSPSATGARSSSSRTYT